MDKVEKLSKFQKITIYFFIYALIGWIFEELFCIITTHEFIKRGFLFGPICPIYGYGALILILCFENYKQKPVKVFLLAALVFSILEYITDFFLQSLFAQRFWDYTGFFLNLNGRITITFSLVWGIISLLFIKLLHPCIEKLSDKLLKRIPLIIQKTIINVLLVIMILDTIISCVIYSGIVVI